MKYIIAVWLIGSWFTGGFVSRNDVWRRTRMDARIGLLCLFWPSVLGVAVGEAVK